MDLHVKRRPKTLDEVFGHKSIIKAIRENISAGRHAWAFVGPAGTGKTTLARIVARELGIEEDGLIEVNGASVNGVEDMRDLINGLSGFSMTSNGKKAVVIDECHRLSKNAWDALLKPLEEPFDHVYWFLASTDAKKIPPAIVSRCLVYTLKELSEGDMAKLLATTLDAEALTIAPGVAEALMEYAHGSPRRLLTGLQAVAGAVNAKDAREILVQPDGTKEAIDFARLLFRKPAASLQELADMGKALREAGETSESLRQVTFRYAESAFLNSASSHALAVMRHFEAPCTIESVGEAVLRGARIITGKP